MFKKLFGFSKAIYNQYREIIAYLFFGVCTTIVSWVTYSICYYLFGMSGLFSDIISWIFSVIFAYITNRLFVFESKSANIIKEASSFISARVLTGIFDALVIFITVDILNYNAAVMKVLVSVVVVALNYIASKLFIFK